MMNSAGQLTNKPSTSAHGASHDDRRGAFGSKNGSPPTSTDLSDETPPHFLWAKSLENVLEDAEALELFLKWMELNDSINPIKFYFAIRAYKLKFDELGTSADVEKTTKTVRLLSYEVYKVFIKDTGDKYCPFISTEAKEQVRVVVKNETGVPPYELFDQCQAELMTLLRKQHALFSQSDELISAINRIEHGEPSDGSLLSTRSPSVASQRFDEESVLREMMDDVSDDEPAVAQSVMSGYSDAVTEQASSTFREPPPLPPRAASPRSRKPPPVLAPKKPKTPKPAKGVALTRKALLTTQTQRSNAVDQRCALPYATASRPLPYVCAANTSKNDSAVSSAFSSEASAGQPYQPGQSHHLSSRQNKDDQARHNPRNRNAIPRNDYLKAQQGTTDQHVTQEQRLAFFNKLRDKLNAMMRKREMEGFMVDQMSAIGTRQQDARTAVAAVAEFERGQEHNVNDEEEDVDVYLNRMNDSNKPSPGSQRSPGGFFAVAPLYRQRRSPKSTSPGPDHHRFAVMTANHAMTSSFPTPYGSQGFAPPPISKHRAYIPSYQFQPPPDSKSPAHYLVSNKRSEQTRPRLAASDTSGIGTGASSADYSHVHDPQAQPSRKYFDKLRQLGQEQQQQAPTGNSGTQKRQKPPPVAASAPYNTSSLPRQGRSQPTSMPVSSSAASSPHAHGMHTRIAHAQQSVDAEMTIGYYTNKDVDKHVPYVKKVPSRPLTFKEFKQHFALGRNKQDQFFFKRSSDDPQNPFELLLVTADAEVLPVFEGKVMAELKSTTDSD